MGIITLSDVLRYIIGDVGISESLGPSETATPANQTHANQTPTSRTPAVQDEDKQEIPIPVVNEINLVAEDLLAGDADAPPPDR